MQRCGWLGWLDEDFVLRRTANPRILIHRSARARSGAASGACSERADVPYTSLAPSAARARGHRRPARRRRAAVRRCRTASAATSRAISLPDCMLYDAGADAYETVQRIIDTYWDYYLFAAFRRERLGFERRPVLLSAIFWRLLHQAASTRTRIYVFDRALPRRTRSAGDPSFDEFYDRAGRRWARGRPVSARRSRSSRGSSRRPAGRLRRVRRRRRDDGVLHRRLLRARGERRARRSGAYFETTWNFDEPATTGSTSSSGSASSTTRSSRSRR